MLSLLGAMSGPGELDSFAKVHHKTVALLVPLLNMRAGEGRDCVRYLGQDARSHLHASKALKTNIQKNLTQLASNG